MKVLCIGHATYDINCFMENFPLENYKYRVQEKTECCGGQASNQAIALARWNIETYISAAVGSDSNGDKIKKEFDDNNVNTNYLETNFDKSTSQSIIVINKLNGSRTVLNTTPYEMAPRLKKEEYNIEPDIILVDGFEYHASMTAINKFPGSISVIDAGAPLTEIIELAKSCKYIIASKLFAETVTNYKIDYNDSRTLLMLYTKMKEKYPKNNIIVTLEEKGALYSNNNQIKVMPGIKVNVKDTTGAGDIFHAMYVYCLLNKYDVETSIALSNVAAGLSCAVAGTKQSIPNINDVITFYNNKLGSRNGTNNNQSNPIS